MFNYPRMQVLYFYERMECLYWALYQAVMGLVLCSV